LDVPDPRDGQQRRLDNGEEREILGWASAASPLEIEPDDAVFDAGDDHIAGVAANPLPDVRQRRHELTSQCVVTRPAGVGTAAVSSFLHHFRAELQ
jgi:hypothetical protein